MTRSNALGASTIAAAASWPLPCHPQSREFDEFGNRLAGLFGTEHGDRNSANLLNMIFGPLFPAEAGSVNSTTFSVLVGQFNVAVLVIGGLMFAWSLTAGVLQSAHEGEVLGRRWSSLWAPLRVVFAVALLIPVPGLGGYNAIQASVAWMVRGSTLMASELWGRSAGLLLTGDLPIADGTARFDGEIFKAVYRNQLCAWLVNHQMETAGSSLRVRFQPFESDDAVRIVSSLDGQRTEICGSYGIPNLPDRIGGLQTGGAPLLVSEFRNLHAGILEVLVAGANKAIARQWPAIVAGDTEVPDISNDIAESIDGATSRLREGNSRLVMMLAGGSDDDRARARRAISDFLTGGCGSEADLAAESSGCGGEGWLGAGNWYMTLARLNSELMGMTSASVTADQSKYISDNLKLLNRQIVVEADRPNWFTRMFGNADVNKYMHVAEADRIWSEAVGSMEDSSLRLAHLGMRLPGRIIEDAAPASSTGLLGRVWKVGFSDEIGELIEILSPSAFDRDPIVGLVNLGNWFIDVSGLLIFGGAAASLLSGGFGTTIVFLIAAPMAAIGVTQSFIIPMLPFVYWILGVASYFLLVAEAVIAATLWALMHFRLDGEGISGDAGRNGWLMLLSLLLTPSLMIIGYLVGMVVFRVVAGLLDIGMHYAMTGLASASPIVGIFGLIATGILVVIAYIVIIERSFSLIADFPDRILKWIGATSGVGDGSGERMFRGAASSASSAIGSAARQIGRMVPGRKRVGVYS